MAEIMKLHHQWATRPADERYTNIPDMVRLFEGMDKVTVARVSNTREIEVRPIDGDSKGLVLVGKAGVPAAPTHWAFGQLAQRAGAPASYMRDLPSPIAADCLNWGLRSRNVEEVGLLLRQVDGGLTLDAATSASYGRVTNSAVTRAILNVYGDGVTGRFRVPGIRGKKLEGVTKENTTLFASAQDMFLMLCDEENRIEIKDRRDGQPGSLARGFIVWNSEVGAQTLGIQTFYFDFVCANRIIWGAEGVQTVRVRHTSGAPMRWIEEVSPAIAKYADGSAKDVVAAINEVRKARLGDEAQVQEFLLKRFTKAQARAISETHMLEEHRPIETLWDAAVGVTAYAKTIQWQDERVAVERKAGDILSGRRAA